MQFKYYVLNYDINQQKVKMFNIFQNSLLNKYTEKEVKKYLRAPSKYMYKRDTIELQGFAALCKEIDGLIMWQEWSRCEYEIGVCNILETNVEKLEKWDCYQQCKPNIETITRDVIAQYKQYLKKEKQ